MVEDKLYRNDPCPCGSGKKFKRCCAIEEEADTTGSFFRIAMGATAIAMVVATGALARGFFLIPAVEESERVWSEEHGHWHNEGSSGGERVWSEEHGHWHGGGNDSGPRPGKVWSEEHGHYHNSDTVIERHTITGSNSEDLRSVEAERARQKLADSGISIESVAPAEAE